MKKRILSVLLVIALLVTVGIVAAQAEDTATTPTPAQIIAAANEMSFPYAAEGEEATNQTGVCPICGGTDEVTWEPLTAATGKYTLNTTQHLYVANEEVDFGTSNVYPEGGNLHLFLNNSTITGSGGYMITNGGTISIFGNGTVTNTTDQEVFYPRSSAWSNRGIVIYGGTYESKTGYAANIWNTKVTSDENFKNFVMYGGEVKGLTMGMGGDALIEGGTISACADGTGAQAVYVYSAGGANANDIIIGGSAEVTGGILQNKVGTVTITGDAEVDTVTTKTGNLTISGGTVTTVNKTSSGDLTVSGGTITTLTTNKGTLAISGGEITTATPSAITMSLSGNPVIGTLDLTAATLPITVADMAEGADVTVNVATGTTIASGLTAEDAQYFSYEDATGLNKVTVDASGNLTVAAKTFDTAEEIIDFANNYMTFPTDGTSKTVYCPVCKANKTWSTMPTSTYLNGGGTAKHYYVPANYETTKAWKNGSATLATHIHLNNSTMTTTNVDYAFSDYGDIVLMGQGTVTQAGTGTVLKSGGNTMKIYGGTYTATANTAYALQVRSATSTWDIYGGTFNGGSTAVMGVTAAGTLNIHGGTFNGAVATTDGTTTISGGEIATVNATGGAVSISGGEITTATVTKATLSLSGAPEITTLDLTGATTLPIAVDNMTSGASIGLNVNAGTTITDGNDADYIGYFSVPVQDSMNVFTTDDNGALVYIAKTFEDPAEIVDYANNHMSFEKGLANDTKVTAFCPICKKDVSWAARTGGGNVNPGGNKHLFFTSETYNLTSKIYTGSGATHIFLNGATINSTTDSGVFYSDTSNTAYGDGGISLLGNGTVNQTGTGYALFGNGGILNVYGGTYTGEKIFHSESDASVINVYGGTFNGDSLFNKGTLNLKGGKVNGTIQLSDPSIEVVHSGAVTFNTDIDVALDLNGHSEVTIGGTGEVTVSDSKNQRTLSSYGTATITNPNVVAADNFVALTEDDSTVGYHYYEAALKGVALKAPAEGEKVGLYYKGAWSMDSKLKEAADIGVVVSLTKMPTATFYSEYEEALANGTAHQNFFYSYAGNSVVNGAAKTSVLVDGILKTGRADAAANDAAGQTKIYAAAYIMIPVLDEDGEIIDREIYVSAPRADGLDQLSAYDVLAKIQAKDGEEALTEFYTKWNQYSNVESIVATLIAG